MKRFALALLVVVALVLVAALGTVAAMSFGAQSAQAALVDPTPTPGPAQAYLGVTVADISANLVTRFGLSQTTGVVITAVAPNTPAAAAGLKPGDVVIAVNGAPVNTAQELTAAVKKGKPGDQVTLNIKRGAESQTIQATAGTAPATQQKNGALPRLGGRSFTLPPEVNGLLDGVAPADRFSHNLGSTRTLKDKNGATVTVYSIPGVVTAISPTSITITPNNPASRGGPFSIDGTTRVLAGAKQSGTDAIAVNDQVTVVVVGDSNHASVVEKGGGLGNFPGGFLGGRGGLQAPKNAPAAPAAPRGFFRQNPTQPVLRQ